MISALLALTLAAAPALRTVEQGESYARKRGLVIADREPTERGIVDAQRSYAYTVENAEVNFVIKQFATARAAQSYIDAISALPFPVTFVPAGRVVFCLAGEDSDEVERVVAKLRAGR